MIRAIVATELLLLLRGRSFRVVLLGYLTLLAGAYLVFYSEFAVPIGVLPAEMRPAFGRRVCLSQTILLTVLTPWVVSLAALPQRRDTLVTVMALTALPPWHMVYGKLLATGMYLGQLLLLSLPLLLLTYLLGAVSPNEIIGFYAALWVWLVLVQLCTMGWSMLVATPLPALILSYVTLLVLSVAYVYLGSVRGEATRTLTTAGLDICLGLLVLRYCPRHLIYLKGV